MKKDRTVPFYKVLHTLLVLLGVCFLMDSGQTCQAASAAVEKTAGYYYIEPKSSADKTVTVKSSSLKERAHGAIGKKADAAAEVWQLEVAGTDRFRLKNVNSGLYLGIASADAKDGSALIQKKYKKGDKTIVFKAFKVSGKATYIRSQADKRYVYVSGSTLRIGKKKKADSHYFLWKKTSRPKSQMKAAGYTYPVRLKYGAAFSLKGTVSSNYSLVWLRAHILSASGNAVQKKEILPYKTSCSLSQVDEAIRFGTLDAGSYHYQVWVRDSSGTEKKVVDKLFSVAIQSISGVGDVNRTLFYNSDLIAEIGHQSTGNALEKKACASYALAYCNAIVKGTVTSPHSYWLSEKTVDCVWSKGSYTTSAFGSEKEVLGQAYAQISAGYPCILHVTGSTEQHWITIIGYKNVLSINNLTTENFIAIDPWDGEVFTVSKRYKVKSTYRLGIQAYS